MDITSLIEYFMKTMQNAIHDSEEEIRKAIEKTRFRDSIRLIPLNEREVKLINRLFDVAFRSMFATSVISTIKVL